MEADALVVLVSSAIIAIAVVVMLMRMAIRRSHRSVGRAARH